jgi:hypothetical protein
MTHREQGILSIMEKVSRQFSIVAEQNRNPSVIAPKQRRAMRPPNSRTAPMYKAYFVRRLLEALSSADEAESEEERSIYLRTSRYYRDLI